MELDTLIKRHIINTLLNGMQTHLDDDTMMRNGCLTLCQFIIPGDFVSLQHINSSKKHDYIQCNLIMQ